MPETLTVIRCAGPKCTQIKQEHGPNGWFLIMEDRSIAYHLPKLSVYPFTYELHRDFPREKHACGAECASKIVSEFLGRAHD